MEEKIRETELSELEKVNNVCDIIVEEVEEISEEEITKCVIKNAKKIGYDYESLSEKEQEKLRKIERIVQAKFALEKKAKAMASRNVVSVQGISKEADISRQTFYNNPIYKEYIFIRAEEFIKIDASKKSSDKNKEVTRLNEEIKKLHERDVELEEVKREVKELRKTLEDKDNRIAMLRKELIKFH